MMPGNSSFFFFRELAAKRPICCLSQPSPHSPGSSLHLTIPTSAYSDLTALAASAHRSVPDASLVAADDARRSKRESWRSAVVVSSSLRCCRLFQEVRGLAGEGALSRGRTVPRAWAACGMMRCFNAELNLPAAPEAMELERDMKMKKTIASICLCFADVGTAFAASSREDSAGPH